MKPLEEAQITVAEFNEYTIEQLTDKTERTVKEIERMTKEAAK
jgi:hypothetical protein